MEVRTHARIIAESTWFIILVTFLVALATFVFAFLRPESYKAAVSFDVALVNRPATSDYQYGAYYDFKAAEIFTQHVMSWFKTPAFVEDIYTAAGIGYEVDSISRFTNRFQPKQYSAQNFTVFFSDHNRDSAFSLATAISGLVEERSATAATVNGQTVFQVTAFDPVIAPAEYTVWFIAIIGACAGLFLSLIAVYIREYFKQ